ncbi:MAG: lipase [Pseudonocardiales bacterium]|nr:MAG: lipase [Pseudonocardiales bacterium]
MRRRWATPIASLAVVVGVVGSVLVGGPAGASARKYPVPYTFLTSALLAAPNADADPPGANHWACKPSAAHPHPVVLVHGLTGNKNTNWQTFSPLLANNGYCVFALTYGVPAGTPLPFNQLGGFTAMESSARELSAFVNRVLAATHATKVDILGHSEGTVMPDYYAKFLGGAAKIDKYVSLAPIWHGTDVLGLATLSRLADIYGITPVVNGLFPPFFASSRELMSGSPFYAKLRSGGTPAVKGIRYTNIVTRYDELVAPYSSGIQAGMHNIVVQDQCALDFSEHFQIAADPVAAADVLNALDPSHPRAVPCRLVLPFVGG